MTLPADRHAAAIAVTLAAIDAATQPRCALLNCYRPSPGEWCRDEHAQRWQRNDFVRVFDPQQAARWVVPAKRLARGLPDLLTAAARRARGE